MYTSLRLGRATHSRGCRICVVKKTKKRCQRRARLRLNGTSSSFSKGPDVMSKDWSYPVGERGTSTEDLVRPPDIEASEWVRHQSHQACERGVGIGKLTAAPRPEGPEASAM